MENPFGDQSSDLYRLDTKVVMIRESLGSNDRIIMRNKPLTDTIVTNKIKIFGLASKLSNNKKTAILLP